jgi:multisubunit Na+/H+ antiporter MnhG subunit
MNWQTLRLYLVTQPYYFLLALSVLICAVFMWIGARLAQVHRANLLKAILAAILSVVVSGVLRHALTATVPLAGSIFGFLLGYLLVLLIIKGVFNTSFLRALVVWFFFLLAQPVSAFFLGRSLFGDLENFF